MTTDTTPEPTLQALLAAREIRNTASGRGSIIEMERDPRAAIAYAISVVNGESSPDRTQAMEALASRIAVLKHGDSEEALEELAASCPLLESLYLRYILEAMASKTPDVKVKYTKLALQCHSAFARTLALVSTLRAQRRGAAKVIVHDDGDDGEAGE